MTRINYGGPLVYIKPDYIIIFFYNIRTYYIYLLILSKLRSHRKDSFHASNTYPSIQKNNWQIRLRAFVVHSTAYKYYKDHRVCIERVEKMLHMSVKGKITLTFSILAVAALSIVLSVGPMAANQALAANLCGSGSHTTQHTGTSYPSPLSHFFGGDVIDHGHSHQSHGHSYHSHHSHNHSHHSH